MRVMGIATDFPSFLNSKYNRHPKNPFECRIEFQCIKIRVRFLKLRTDATLPLAVDTEFRKHVDYKSYPNIESSFS